MLKLTMRQEKKKKDAKVGAFKNIMVHQVYLFPHVPGAACSFFTCWSSIEPSPPLNMIGLIHSRRSPLAKRIPKERAKP